MTASATRPAQRAADLPRPRREPAPDRSGRRLGGEEFVVVLADAASINAYLVADRLRNAFAVNAAVLDGVACTRPRASACR